MLAVTLIAVLVVLVLLAFVAWRLLRDAPARDELARLRAQAEAMDQLAEEARQRAATIERLQMENARLAADLDHTAREAGEKLKLLEAAEARLKTEFENLANRIFEDKGSKLTEQNRERLSGLLQPFRDQLDAFRKRVDEVHSKDTEQTARLIEQVRQLQQLSNKVSDEANQLARAIQGEAKTQGDWGELIVERIFEASGLPAEVLVDSQETFRDKDGRARRPDFIVKLPTDRWVIVDAKVSLTAYVRYTRAGDDAAKAAALADHIVSARRHIQDLDRKDYTALLGNRTLDFVLLCIPSEPAYQLLMEHDPDLIRDLAGTKVVVCGPNTLMITLKLIAQIWRREHENRNAEVIAGRAGRLYDQVALVAEALLDAQRKLEGVSGALDLAMKRLSTGRGNLVGRVEELRKLGAKVSKPLPIAVVEAGSDEEEDAPPALLVTEATEPTPPSPPLSQS